jgi:hypothetical protein
MKMAGDLISIEGAFDAELCVVTPRGNPAPGSDV